VVTWPRKQIKAVAQREDWEAGTGRGPPPQRAEVGDTSPSHAELRSFSPGYGLTLNHQAVIDGAKYGGHNHLQGFPGGRFQAGGQLVAQEDRAATFIAAGSHSSGEETGISARIPYDARP